MKAIGTAPAPESPKTEQTARCEACRRRPPVVRLEPAIVSGIEGRTYLCRDVADCRRHW